MAQWLL